MKRPIYLDNHSTTPVDPEVLGEMLPLLKDEFGNAASRQHGFGRRAAERVEKARGYAAKLIGAQPEEIVFTSGATEANNLAIKGAARMYRGRGNHLVTCVTEHKSVLAPFRALEAEGFKVTYLPVERDGRLDPARVDAALTDKTTLLSVMAANNEIGVLNPLKEIGAIAQRKGVIFHTDAAQAAGLAPLNVREIGADLLSFSAHKIYGPQGVGALYVRKRDPRTRLEPLIDGGGHEAGLRSGTLNAPGIAGFGAACRLAAERLAKDAAHAARLRDRLKDGLLKRIDEAQVNGSWDHRLPNNLNISFAYVESESLLKRLDDIAVSSGAACASAVLEPSYVLKALGVSEELAHGSIRFGIGRFNTEEEIDFVIGRFADEIAQLRAMSPLYRMAKEGLLASSIQWNESKV